MWIFDKIKKIFLSKELYNQDFLEKLKTAKNEGLEEIEHNGKKFPILKEPFKLPKRRRQSKKNKPYIYIQRRPTLKQRNNPVFMVTHMEKIRILKNKAEIERTENKLTNRSINPSNEQYLDSKIWIGFNVDRISESKSEELKWLSGIIEHQFSGEKKDKLIQILRERDKERRERWNRIRGVSLGPVMLDWVTSDKIIDLHHLVVENYEGNNRK